jgi:hypothetical protein
MAAHNSQKNEKTVARQTHALSALVRLLARQVAKEVASSSDQTVDTTRTHNEQTD